jgi:hypothetical protein
MSIILYKGDNSNFGGLRTIQLTLDTTLDLTGYTAEFSLQGKRKLYSVPDSKILDLVFDNDETDDFALGECFGTLRISDTSNRWCTFADRIPFEIVQEVVGTQSDDYTLEITVDGTQVIITVQSFFDYGDLVSKPSINSVTLVGNKTSAQLGLIDALGTEFAVTGWSELKTVDLSNCTVADLCNLVGTLINRLG